MGCEKCHNCICGNKKTLIIYLIDGRDLKYRIVKGDYRNYHLFYMVVADNIFHNNEVVGNASNNVELKDLFDESKYMSDIGLIESKQFDHVINIALYS